MKNLAASLSEGEDLSESTQTNTCYEKDPQGRYLYVYGAVRG